MTTENRLTREQWDAKRDALMVGIDGATITHYTATELASLFHGPRPDDASSVEWTMYNHTRRVMFADGKYCSGANPQRKYKEVVQLAHNVDIDNDDTLFALLALNPDGPVARLQAERDTWRTNYMHVADAICRESKGVDDLVAQARAIREERDTLHLRIRESDGKLAEALRHLGTLKAAGAMELMEQRIALQARVTELEAKCAAKQGRVEALMQADKHNVNTIAELRAEREAWRTNYTHATAELHALKGQEPCGYYNVDRHGNKWFYSDLLGAQRGATSWDIETAVPVYRRPVEVRDDA